MARNGSIRVIFFLALAACGAMCQERQTQWSSVPDAPSAVFAREVPGSVSGGREPVLAGGESVAVGGMVSGGGHSSSLIFGAMGSEGRQQGQSSDFFTKHLYSAQRNVSYRPLAGGSLMGRATFAASRTFITRDPSGKGKLNTSYFLGVLSSALAHTAYRPYWRRSVGAPFSDFGSTVGNDAGMNLWHEFGPGIQQMMKSHTPKFVERIEESVERR
jgi:hypothetical protein